MSKVDTLVQDFLAQKTIAVVGVSDKRETGCNANYDKFRKAGYTVYPVNPHLPSFKGERCYPTLKSLPATPDAVFILASPRVTEQIVGECVELGVKHVWMHCLMGVKPGAGAGMTSVSAQAVEVCRANGIAVIPGSCPNQFLQADFGHAMMRGIMRMIGNLNLN